MTRERAVELLKEIQFCCDLENCRNAWDCEECVEAWEMAIKALEQEPSEDCISRADLQELFNVTTTSLMDKIDQKDIEHLVRACFMVTEIIQDAPSVVPKRGKWGHYLKEGLKWKCSECGSRYTVPWSYCPNCGARME